MSEETTRVVATIDLRQEVTPTDFGVLEDTIRTAIEEALLDLSVQHLHGVAVISGATVVSLADADPRAPLRIA